MNIMERLLNQIADTDEGVALILAACESLPEQQVTTAEERTLIKHVERAAAHSKWSREFAARHEVAA